MILRSDRTEQAKQTARKRGILLSNVAKGLVVVGSDAASWYIGAHPEQAILLLGVDAQHTPPLPLVRVLQGTGQESASSLRSCIP